MHIFKNAQLFNPATCTWTNSSFSVENGRIVAVVPVETSLHGDMETDLKGALVIPGLIDSHVHVESSMVVPHEYGQAIIGHGVTTAIADPHEIANVAGIPGIDFMIEDAKLSPADIFFMVPSCVPATPADIGGAVITADDLKKYCNNPAVLGLGEMMNLPGVLSNDPEVLKKLALFKHVDGHAPCIVGESLQGYVAHGICTDHETVTVAEGIEKLQSGLFLLLRGGEAANNLKDLAHLITPITASRCSFCTDDRHLGSILREGSIDNCIREVVAEGIPLELALRLATFSAAECFGLTDRGFIAPGRIADFCIVTDNPVFTVKEVYKNGVKYEKKQISAPDTTFVSPPFVCKMPTKEDLELPKGDLRVIGVTPGSLVTQALHLPQEDLAKIVCLDRYRGDGFGVGLISGLHLKKGAVACSVAHDTHNLIVAGANDEDILSAIAAVTEAKGGLCIVIDGEKCVFPLPVGGIMTDKPYEQAFNEYRKIGMEEMLKSTGAVPSVFMNLSFMSLTVIPSLKITPRGLFDGESFRDVPVQW